MSHPRRAAPDADVLERVSGAVRSHALASAEALFNSAGVAFEREIGSGIAAQTLVQIAESRGCEPRSSNTAQRPTRVGRPRLIIVCRLR